MSCSVTQLSPSSPYTPLPGTNADDSNEQSTALKSIKSLAPLLDRVLVQRVKMDAKTAGGIYLPESSVKELNEAKVLAVGPGGLDKDGKRVSCSVAPGDKVLIPQYGGSPVKVGDEEYHLFRDHDILAKINE
ncbi:chaperonin 10-like protein [Hyaloscypha sp. PMI_1271]|nr:chaperonin 10-like protein [Hyaloscypha sp. PMI_1271]